MKSILCETCKEARLLTECIAQDHAPCFFEGISKGWPISPYLLYHAVDVGNHVILDYIIHHLGMIDLSSCLSWSIDSFNVSSLRYFLEVRHCKPTIHHVIEACLTEFADALPLLHQHMTYRLKTTERIDEENRLFYDDDHAFYVACKYQNLPLLKYTLENINNTPDRIHLILYDVLYYQWKEGLELISSLECFKWPGQDVLASLFSRLSNNSQEENSARSVIFERCLQLLCPVTHGAVCKLIRRGKVEDVSLFFSHTYQISWTFALTSTMIEEFLQEAIRVNSIQKYNIIRRYFRRRMTSYHLFQALDSDADEVIEELCFKGVQPNASCYYILYDAIDNRLFDIEQRYPSILRYCYMPYLKRDICIYDHYLFAKRKVKWELELIWQDRQDRRTETRRILRNQLPDDVVSYEINQFV